MSSSNRRAPPRDSVGEDRPAPPARSRPDRRAPPRRCRGGEDPQFSPAFWGDFFLGILGRRRAGCSEIFRGKFSEILYATWAGNFSSFAVRDRGNIFKLPVRDIGISRFGVRGGNITNVRYDDSVIPNARYVFQGRLYIQHTERSVLTRTAGDCTGCHAAGCRRRRHVTETDTNGLERQVDRRYPAGRR
jgi:hypothetical protein